MSMRHGEDREADSQRREYDELLCLLSLKGHISFGEIVCVVFYLV